MSTEGPGIRLMAWEERLRAGLQTEIVGHPILAYERVDSTNDVVKEMALHGAPDGLCVLASSQNSGRGRRGRTWHSVPGKAVYLSILLRPPWKAGEVTWLGVLGGVAAAESVDACGVTDLLIKWPNDVLARGLKIGGVLVEPRLGEDDLAFAVMGIGINVRQEDADWPPELRPVATSCAAMGADVACEEVAIRLIQRLDDWYRRLLQGEREPLLESWSRWSGSARLPVLD